MAFHLAGVVLPEGNRRDLWISGGRITFSPVDGARTLAEDVFLLPGLVDAHCHPGIAAADIEEAAAQAEADRRAGTLLIRDCGVPLDNRALQDRADLPRLIRCGRHLALRKRYVPGLGIELDSPDELPAAVAAQAEDGDGWVKLVGDWIDRGAGDLAPLWPDEVLVEAVRVAHDAGAKVTAHVFGEEALPGLLAAGVDCLEHGLGLDSAQLAEMAARGVALVPTLVNILENFPGIADAAGKYPVYAAHMRALHAKAPSVIRAAVEAGVAVYVGTDAGGMVEHGRIADEIDALHAAGMNRAEVLGAASWAAREWLGFPGIAEGESADLLVFTEDPREDLAVLRRPAHTILRGALY